MKSLLPAESLAESEGAAPPRPPQALEELRLRARAMEAGQDDRDALLNELERVPEPDEDPSARADVLRLIIEDPWLGGFAGSDGRRVDAAAAQALVDLGEPYASALSPEGRAALERQPEPPSPLATVPGPHPVPRAPAALTQAEETPDRSGMGQVIATVLAGIELLVLLTSMSNWPRAEVFMTFAIAICVLTLAPAFLPRRDGWEALRKLCTVMMGLVGLPFLLVSIPGMYFAGLFGAIPLAYGLARMFATYCLYNAPPTPEEPEDA